MSMTLLFSCLSSGGSEFQVREPEHIGVGHVKYVGGSKFSTMVGVGGDTCPI